MKRHRVRAAVVLCLALPMLLSTTALADTDSNTLKVTQQPDQLVLQLGARWAGVEFELRTDAGVFPVPVVVDESGVLTMDLGGSTTYTLSCIDSNVPIPDPEQIPVDAAQDELQTSEASAKSEDSRKVSVPPAAIAVFVIGVLSAAVGGSMLFISKRREQSRYEDWEDEEDAP